MVRSPPLHSLPSGGALMPGARRVLHFKLEVGNGLNGAGKRNRTSDLLITNQLLYRLSYSGT